MATISGSGTYKNTKALPIQTSCIKVKSSKKSAYQEQMKPIVPSTRQLHPHTRFHDHKPKH